LFPVQRNTCNTSRPMTTTIGRDEGLYLILSIERTNEGKTCVWWRNNRSGYTSNLEVAGLYSRDEARAFSDPPHHLAIPLTAIEIPKGCAKMFARAALKKK
jgi:hypothetical protein